MTTRDAFLPDVAQPLLDDLAALAIEAESLRDEWVWVPESWGREAATTNVAHPETIGHGTSLLIVFSQSPTLLGQLAATLQVVSGGRYRLGLGPSGPRPDRGMARSGILVAVPADP